MGPRVDGLPVDQIDADRHAEDQEGGKVEKRYELERRRRLRLTVEVHQRPSVEEDAVQLHEQTEHDHSEEEIRDQGRKEGADHDDVMEEQFEDPSGTLVD